MTDVTGKIIEQQQLDNGMELVFLDRSRVAAGDRWLVELACEAHIPIDESYWDTVDPEDVMLLPEIRQLIGGRLVFVTTRQRNFVDASECEKVLQDMVQQIRSSILAYLQKPHFPRELFKKQFRDARQKVLIQQTMNLKK